MFKNISYNDYRPDYKGNFIGEINLQAPTGNYYVGSRTSDPIDIISPNNELPQDKDGNKIQTATRGYGELGKLYENNLEFNFGLNSTGVYDDGGIQGGFTWVSRENSPTGLKLGQGGKPIGDFLSKIEKNYNFNAPENSIPDLIKAYQMVQSLEDSNWKKIKLEVFVYLLLYVMDHG